MSEALEALQCHQRDENAAGARRLLAADAVVTEHARTLVEQGHRPGRARTEALAEIAIGARCTMHTAEMHHLIGRLLQTHLPMVRDAALAGLLDYPRLAKIHHYVGDLEPDVIRRLQADILAAARAYPPAALGKELERLIVSADPAAAEFRRLRQQTRRHVRCSAERDGMQVLRAYLPAADAVAVDAAIERVAGTCCPRDVRDAGNLRADAIVALALGQDRLDCRCGFPDCAAAAGCADGAVGEAGVGDDDEVAGAGRAGGADPGGADPGEADSGEAAVSPDAGGAAGERPWRGVPCKPATHVYVHVDLVTLLHLSEAPAYLEGYGRITAGYARMLAENATWQLLFTEARSLASRWCAAHPEHGAAGGMPGSAPVPADGGIEGDPLAGVDPDLRDDDGYLDPEAFGFSGGFDTRGRQADGTTAADLDDPEYLSFLEEGYRDYCLKQNALRRSRMELAGADPAAGPGAEPGPILGRAGTAPPAPLWRIRLPVRRNVPVIGDGVLVDAIMASAASGEAAERAADPTGHGGRTTAPAGALTYRPRRAVARLVRLRDGHCRFPGCITAADRCQLDHLVPFDRDDPAAGGWTVPENLHCLCQAHHQLKTSRFWQVTLLDGGAELWTSLVTGQQMASVPGGRHRMLDLPDLDPRRSRRSRRQPVCEATLKVAFGSPGADTRPDAEPAPF